MDLRDSRVEKINGKGVCNSCLAAFTIGEPYLSAYLQTSVTPDGLPSSSNVNRRGLFHQECVELAGKSMPLDLDTMKAFMVQIRDTNPKLLYQLYKFMHEALDQRL